jgi:dihydrofolate reductase
MVSSLDGFIAKKDNSISWFETADHYEKGVEYSEEQTKEFLKTIDCYVMGARTYEHAAELSKTYGWPYGEVPTIVLSHKNPQPIKWNIEIYSGDLHRLLNEKLQPNYKNIWVVGGTSLVKEFIQLKLANEIRLSILPIILGDGIPFFDRVEREQALHLKNVLAYKSGMVELWYEIKE